MSTWQIDPAHTNIEFAVRHMMIATVRGRFGEFSGEITESNGGLGVKISIPVASIDTRQSQRDDHLRSADFFDAASHPTIDFVGSFDGDPKTGGQLNGDLTIRGTTKKVALEVEGNGSAKDPWGNERLGFTAVTKIDRRNFGLTWNQALETGGIAVGHEVKITIDVELMRPAQ